MSKFMLSSLPIGRSSRPTCAMAAPMTTRLPCRGRLIEQSRNLNLTADTLSQVDIDLERLHQKRRGAFCRDRFAAQSAHRIG
jgi:hypothetical protein